MFPTCNSKNIYSHSKREREGTVRKYCHKARQKPSRVNLKSCSSICGVWRFSFKRLRWLSPTALPPAICTSPLSWFLSCIQLSSIALWWLWRLQHLGSLHYNPGFTLIISHMASGSILAGISLLQMVWHQQLSETTDKEPRTFSLSMS